MAHESHSASVTLALDITNLQLYDVPLGYLQIVPVHKRTRWSRDEAKHAAVTWVLTQENLWHQLTSTVPAMLSLEAAAHDGRLSTCSRNHSHECVAYFMIHIKFYTADTWTTTSTTAAVHSCKHCNAGQWHTHTLDPIVPTYVVCITWHLASNEHQTTSWTDTPELMYL